MDYNFKAHGLELQAESPLKNIDRVYRIHSDAQNPERSCKSCLCPLILRIYLFFLLQHADELLDALGPRLGFPGGMNSVENRVTVAAVQRGEECSRLRVAIQFGLKIVRHYGLAGRGVSGVPPPILPGALHRFQAGRLHLPDLDQPLRLLRVDLRPDAFRAARRELLQPRRFVITLLLAVYPSIAQRHFERLVVGHGLYPGRLLGQLEPDAGRRRMVFVQPDGPVFLAPEWQDWRVGILGAR